MDKNAMHTQEEGISPCQPALVTAFRKTSVPIRPFTL